MRMRWKLAGLAGLAGVAGTGVMLARRRRTQRQYQPPKTAGRSSLDMLGAIAEFEHALVCERTLDGLAAARARGRTGGQKPRLGPARSSRRERCTTRPATAANASKAAAQIAAEFGVSRPTMLRHLARAESRSRRRNGASVPLFFTTLRNETFGQLGFMTPFARGW
jgi:hypothetical protein